MAYVDGFVAAVPTAKKDAYLAFAKLTAQVFKDCGALSVLDAWGDDVPEGKLTSFPKAVQLAPDETVAFGWVIWPSKDARKAGMAKAEKDDRLTNADMPFDGKRMVFGGFNVISEA